VRRAPRVALVALALVITGRSALSQPIEPHAIRVVDGDTIEARGEVWRLVGFDTPETGSRARCSAERDMGNAASRRLRELIAPGSVVLVPVPCACPVGTQGTQRCNRGRQCAWLTVQGRDAGAALIAEGLARPFVCGPHRCPRRAPWCDARAPDRGG
jgi:endonuclease YncB( thermonuclease family)